MTSDKTTPDIAYTSDHPIVLNEDGPAERIPHDEVKGLLGAEGFSIDFDIASAPGESGEILRFGSSLVVSVDSSGELVLEMETDAGPTSLQTSGADLADAAPHEVGIGYADGRLTVTVDGTAMAKTEMSPIVAHGSKDADLHLGNPSSGDNFVSKIGSLTIATSGGESTGEEAEPVEEPVSEDDSAPEGDPAAGEDPDPEEDPISEEEDPTSGEDPETGEGSDEAPEENDPEEDETESEEGGGSFEGDTIRVTSSGELYAALSQADGGETVLLDGGDYGEFRLSKQSGFDYDYASEVTIASADPSDPATFSGLDIRDAGNLGFEGIVFDYTFDKDDPYSIRPFVINGGEGISIRDSVFDGDLARGGSSVTDGAGWGTGLSVRNAVGVTIEETEFREFRKGAVLQDIDDLVVRDNDIHSMRMDGLNFVAVQEALIEGNHIHDFNTIDKSSDHPDMIQFWSNGANRPSTDTVIRGNTLDIGTGDPSHSIFIRNEEVDNGRAGYEMFNRDFTIEDNMIVNGHLHGITVGETDGLVIRNNSVLHADGRVQDGADGRVEIPRINVADAARNVTVEGNLTSQVNVAPGADRTIQNNTIVQDQNPREAGYYGDVFLSSSLQPEEGAHLFFARPGGLVDQAGVGAPATLASSEELWPGFHIEALDADASVRIFDATPTLQNGAPIEDGAKFEWRFSDGTTVTEKVFAAVFENGGPRGVELTVTLPDGTARSVADEFDVTGPEVLRFGSRDELIVDGTNTIDFAKLDKEGVDLDGPGAVAEIPRQHVVDLVGADEFSIDFTLEGTQEDASGAIFRLGTSFVGSVQKDGDILIQAATEDGRIRFETSGPAVNDGEAHEVEVDLADGVLQIAIDGQAAGNVDMSAPISDDSTHGLYLGSPWGGNFEGRLSNLEITVAESDFETTETRDIPELSSFDPLNMG